MADAETGTVVGTVEEVGQKKTSTGKTLYKIKIKPLDGSKPLTWTAWPEIGGKLEIDKAYEFETEISDGDRGKFYNLKELVREVDPAAAPQAAAPAVTRGAEGQPGTDVSSPAEHPRAVALRAAVAARRTALEFIPASEATIDAEPTRIVVWAREFELYLTGGDSARKPNGSRNAPTAEEAKPEPDAAPAPRSVYPKDFTKIGQLMKWALDIHGLGVLDVVKALGVETPAEIVDLPGSAEILQKHAESRDA